MSVESAASPGSQDKGCGVGGGWQRPSFTVEVCTYPGGREGGWTESLPGRLLMEQRDVDRRVFFLLLRWEI